MAQEPGTIPRAVFEEIHEHLNKANDLARMCLDHGKSILPAFLDARIDENKTLDRALMAVNVGGQCAKLAVALLPAEERLIQSDEAMVQDIRAMTPLERTALQEAMDAVIKTRSEKSFEARAVKKPSSRSRPSPKRRES